MEDLKKKSLRPPSPALQAKIREWIAKPADQWPSSAFKQKDALLIHGSAALYVFGISAKGEMFYLDLDSFAGDLIPMRLDDDDAIKSVAYGSREHPELCEMLPGRPSHAIDCPKCKTSSGDDCPCLGLGWTELS